MENYRRDARVCREEFEILFAPAISKAEEDARANVTSLPLTFPRRSDADDRAENIAPFKERPPAEERTEAPKKRKQCSRAQMALDAIEFGTTAGFETVISIATEGFCKQIQIP